MTLLGISQLFPLTLDQVINLSQVFTNVEDLMLGPGVERWILPKYKGKGGGEVDPETLPMVVR